MAKAIVIHELGGPEVLRYEEVPDPVPGDGEVLLRQGAIGLNFLDVTMRTGHYPVKPALPFVPGMEGAGVIEAVGPGVAGIAVGDRVSHCMTVGSYTDLRVIPARRLVSLPDGISEETAAAATLQGLTAEYLLRSCYAVQPGDVVLVHAAAGGMGLLLCQWAKLLGATVLGTVGSDEKAVLARDHGCDHTIVYTREDFAARVRELTGGEGVNAVYDAVGKDTFEGGMASLRRFGHMVNYGNTSGPVPPVDILTMGAKSTTITRGALGVYYEDPEDRARRARDLWALIASGKLRVAVNQRYPLAEAATAHRDLAGRKTTGSSILLP